MSKTMKKAFSVLLAAAMAAGMTVPAAAEEKETTLKMIYWHPEQKDIMEEINGMFEEENPGVTVELELVPGDEYDKVLKTRLLSDNGPDVYMYFGSLAYQYAEEGHLVDLSEEDFAQNVIPAYTGTCSADGKLYAIPLNAQAYGVWYNKAVFEEAGIEELPATYGEFLDICETLKEKGFVPIARGAKDLWTSVHELGPLANSFVFNTDEDFQMERYNGDITFEESPEMNRFFEEYIRLVDNGYIEEGVLGLNHSQAMQGIADGETAMVLGLSTFYADIKSINADVEIGYFPLPDEEGNVTMSGTSDKAIGYWPKSKNVDLAKALVGFYARPEINKLYCEATQMLPCIKDVVPKLDEPLVQISEDLGKAETIFGALDGPWPAPAYETYRKAIQSVHSGERDVKKMLSDMDAAYDENMDLIGAPGAK